MGLIGHVDENLGSLLMSNPVHKESGLLALFLILPKAERALPLSSREQRRLLFRSNALVNCSSNQSRLAA
jgi:hypothetical protein